MPHTSSSSPQEDCELHCHLLLATLQIERPSTFTGREVVYCVTSNGHRSRSDGGLEFEFDDPRFRESRIPRQRLYHAFIELLHPIPRRSDSTKRL